MPLEFRYFRAPESDMDPLPGSRACSFCGQTDRCFSLDSAPDTAGCVECLRLGHFGFSHDTEVGLVTEEDFIPHGEPDDEPKRVFIVTSGGEAEASSAPHLHPPHPHVSEEAIAELRRTPSFSTWQEVAWPVHCDDFMAYLGIWGPEEFAEADPEGEGRRLFPDMVEPRLHRRWPDESGPRFGQNFVAFECLHCQTRTGIWDID